MSERRPRFAVWFYAPYLMIILVLLVLGSVITKLTLDLVISEQTQLSHARVTDAAVSIDTALSSVEQIQSMLMRDTHISNITSTTNHDTQIKELLEIQKNYNVFRKNLPILQDYGLYIADNTIALYSDRTVLYPERIYENAYRVGDYSWEEFKSEILSASTSKAKFYQAVDAHLSSAGTHRCVLYTKPYVNLDSGGINGMCLYYLREDKLKDILNVFDIDDKSFVQLLSGDTLLTGIGENADAYRIGTDNDESIYSIHRFGEESYYVSTAHSPVYGLDIKVATSYTHMKAACIEKLMPVYACMAVLLTAVILIAVYTFMKSHNPLRSISSKIGDSNGFAGIDSALNEMSDNIDELENKLKIQRKQMLFAQLIHGFSSDEAEMEEMLAAEDVDISNETRGGYMLITGVENKTDDEMIRLTLKAFDVLDTQAEIKPLIMEGPALISLLYTAEDTRILFEVYRRLSQQYNIKVHFYLGTDFDRLKNAHASFREARRIMRSDSAPEDKYLSSAETFDAAEAFNYSHKDEDRIINLIVNGHRDELIRAIEEVYKANFSANNLTAQMRAMLYWRMISGFTRCGCTVKLTAPELILPHGDLDPRDFFDAFTAQALNLAQEAEINREQERIEADEWMVRFVDENFMNPDMSITMLAMQSGMSEPYTSSHFKQKCGIPFSAYLELKRIEKAKLLLNDNKLSVSEVGEMVGYSSSTAFGRAFKRVVGCTPGEYRLKNTEQ